MKQYDLIVLGAGSGGVAAALSAGRQGLRVLLIERAESLGGNAARGGVNTWEPGAGGTGIPFEIYLRLKRHRHAVGIHRLGRHLFHDSSFPGGEAILDPSLKYIDTLRRFLLPGEDRWQVFRSVAFEPEVYAAQLGDMLAETGNVTVLLDTALRSAKVEGRTLVSVELSDGSQYTADAFVDGSADIHLARAAGCACRSGQDGRSAHDESAAPEKPTTLLNGVTQIYRVSPIPDGTKPSIAPLPDNTPADCWWASCFPNAVFNEYPAGGYNVNMLPTMEGDEFQNLGLEKARSECDRRVRAHWHHIQTILPEMRRQRLTWIAPAIGVREGPRLIGRYILTQHDLQATLRDQDHNDIVAIADHAMDVHGEAHVCKELSFPYGVPYRCLLPVEVDNLVIACRGASFSAIAASSCRLSRTMLQLGQAAGTAIAIAKNLGVTPAEVPPAQLREALRAQHVQLEWPIPMDLAGYLTTEGSVEPELTYA